MKKAAGLQAILEAVTATAKSGRLVAFVGAGPSTEEPLNLPTWREMCGQLAELASGFQPARGDLIRHEISTGQWL